MFVLNVLRYEWFFYYSPINYIYYLCVLMDDLPSHVVGRHLVTKLSTSCWNWCKTAWNFHHNSKTLSYIIVITIMFTMYSQCKENWNVVQEQKIIALSYHDCHYWTDSHTTSNLYSLIQHFWHFPTKTVTILLVGSKGLLYVTCHLQMRMLHPGKVQSTFYH